MKHSTLAHRIIESASMKVHSFFEFKQKLEFLTIFVSNLKTLFKPEQVNLLILKAG